MLDRQGGQMRIGDEIGYGLSFAEHLLEDRPMSLSRVHNSRTWLIQPTLNP